jgi:hypothetical protein
MPDAPGNSRHIAAAINPSAPLHHKMLTRHSADQPRSQTQNRGSGLRSWQPTLLNTRLAPLTHEEAQQLLLPEVKFSADVPCTPQVRADHQQLLQNVHIRACPSLEAEAGGDVHADAYRRASQLELLTTRHSGLHLPRARVKPLQSYS